MTVKEIKKPGQVTASAFPLAHNRDYGQREPHTAFTAGNSMLCFG
jgi:hypothetical protein